MLLFGAMLLSGAAEIRAQNRIEPTPTKNVQVRGDLLERMERAVRYLDEADRSSLWSGFRKDLLPGHSEGMWGADWPGRSLEAYCRTALSVDRAPTQRFYEIAYGLLAHQQPDGAFHNGDPVGGDLVGGMTSDLENKCTGFWFGNGMGLTGLVWASRYAPDNPRFDTAARALGDYIVEHYFDEDQGGRPNPFWWCITNALAELYRSSGDQKYLDMALRISETIPPVIKDSMHTHSYLLALRGIAQACELAGDQPELMDKLMEQYLYFRDHVMWPGGGIVEHLGSRENYIPDFWYDEGCSVADWLGLNLVLWRITQDTQYMDMAERVALNHLLFDQDALGGFCGERGVDFIREGSPWPFCCAQKGTTTLSELTQYVASTDGSQIYLNLFCPATVQLDFAGSPVAIDLETDYPASGRLSYSIQPARGQQFPVKIRVPAWSSVESVSVNGQQLADPVITAGYLVLDRNWDSDSKVEVALAMPLRTESRPHFFGDPEDIDYSRVSVWQGPRQLVFNEALNLALWKEQDTRPALRYSYKTYDEFARDTTVKGTHLKTGEIPYEKGLGVYPVSEMVFALNGEFKEFISDIGLDVLSEGRGAVRFKVCVDGLLMSGDAVEVSMAKDGDGASTQASLYGFQSSAITGADPARTIRVDVEGAQVLRLCVDNGVFGFKDNYANWGGARLLRADGSEVYLSDLPDDREAGQPWDWGMLQLQEVNDPTQEPGIVTLAYKTETGERPVRMNYLADLGYSLIERRPVLMSYMKVD